MVQKPPKSPPLGRPVLPQKFIDGFRLERCALAIADLAHEVGPGAITAGAVIERVKMARATFYELFDGRDAAFRYACELGAKTLVEPARIAGGKPGPWEERLNGSIGALLEAASENPNLAELSLVHSAALLGVQAGPGAVVDSLVDVWKEFLPPGSEKWRSIDFAEPAAHGTVSIIARRLLEGEPEVLSELRGELTTLVATPYRQVETAGR